MRMKALLVFKKKMVKTVYTKRNEKPNINEQIIAISVITKHIFSILSILCAKLPLDNNTNIAMTTPIITIGAMSVECRNVVKSPTTIIPTATKAVK